MARNEQLARVLRPGRRSWGEVRTSSEQAPPFRGKPIAQVPPVLSDQAEAFIDLVRSRFGDSEASRVTPAAAEAKEALLKIWLRRARYFDSLDAAMSYRLTCRLAVDRIRFDDIYEHAVHSALKRWCLRLVFCGSPPEDFYSEIHARAEWLWDCPDHVMAGVVADLRHHGSTLLVCETESMTRSLAAGTKLGGGLHTQVYSPAGRLPRAF